VKGTRHSAELCARTGVCKGGEWAASGGGGADAADLLFAAVVQPVRPRSGRSAVRFGGDAAVCGIDLGRDPVEEHELGERLFERVGEHLQAKGLRLSTGTIVDATIINAPSSTKNVRQERDPEMHQTRKGKQWCVSRTRAQARDAVSKMGDGLPKPAYRSRFQTARCCCVRKAWW
jgi:hypothetical protein